ncbi:MAG: phenylalanine--tRNA ligase subunit beta [gamma proteobacterium symbiont of Ctena orbiculata]|uniref:Phenylalanine--tRNA ligase beta subunit n=1 Tax=Candidatus Thiodiazotropha taylori TaxID=2792791 RepID=A0A944MB28_9GAMM|nr:phenylalanine--tRNA ligase subunit beta [Candidatus Thiodiazotropha taylori]PUB85705.1 MAG: phenylalanine--tRNA ligase subunit beta [gamma proteobacterium symbiont of Ctena orbiculata]MBT2988137.1 phenylalanine--tRNA ligase subunit beta [Candidatus Thiodiazotropha taylori]MBT2998501.1 phenylalanine--tRNA ligase subunit beta [Candidatus Thiodiazotropha taylori]MBT3002121.1 phenylalanine--tRNA ligase subunit beta [Candidatus Thiodiazotropha taylori]
MKFSESWLREWVDPTVTTQELADQLSMAGLEVDSVESVAAAFNGVVVGEVLSREQHPDADKLSVCRVNVDGGEPLQIVCGATNVAAGMRVPVATVGALLPGDFKIKKAKLRGVESSGMICSASELGLAESSDGIMPLPEDAPVGEDFRQYLKLEDSAIDVDLTPDRGDCLGIAGIAREVGVINRCQVKPPAIDAVEAAIDDRVEVDLEADEACPRYLCRVVRDVDVNAQTPLWMQERLRRSDIRSLGPVVDVTNYVLLELGQPMHGFDLERISEKIRVRMAQAGEKLILIGGQEVDLDTETLVIADADQPVALAGIMGGEASAVNDTTRHILLESAFFAPTAISGKARSYGLHTDSSHRFERGVDPQLQAMAMERATALLIEIAGGRPGPIVEACNEQRIEPRPLIELRAERVNKVLGVEIDGDEVNDILIRLEMAVNKTEQGWQVRAPSSRFDIAIEEDLIEEIGRIYGYARIPAHRGLSAMEMRERPETDFDLNRARMLLVGRDYQEVITYSFVSPEIEALIDPEKSGIRLANPISADMSVMRTSIWPGLLQTARYNQSRQQQRVRIFETGLCFFREDGEITQEPVLAGLVTGDRFPEQWGGASRAADFYDLKADVEALLSLSGRREAFTFTTAEHAALHPGQSAAISLAGENIGLIGMLHPQIEKKLDLNDPALVFEIKLDKVAQGSLPAFETLSKFPSIRRDIAIVVDQSVTFESIRNLIRDQSGKIVTDIILFDVYTGENIDSGRKSLALGLILQEKSHTLTDKEVEDVVAKVLNRLAEDFGAKLRD